MPKICNFTEKWTPPRKFPYEFPKLFKKLFLRTPSSSCSRRLLFYCKINIAIILLMQSNAEALLEPCHIYDGTFSQKYVNGWKPFTISISQKRPAMDVWQKSLPLPSNVTFTQWGFGFSFVLYSHKSQTRMTKRNAVNVTSHLSLSCILLPIALPKDERSLRIFFS